MGDAKSRQETLWRRKQKGTQADPGPQVLPEPLCPPPVGVQDTEGGLYMTFSFHWVPEQILLPVTQEALILNMKRSCQVARGVQSQAAS